MKQLLFIFSLLSAIFFQNTLSASGDITSGLIAHYEFEDNINDSTNTYNLSIAAGGSEAYSTSGKYGKAYLFNGSDNYLKTLDNAITEGNTGTISFWVKDTVDSGQAYVGMQNNSGATTYNPVIYTDASQNLGAYGNTHEYPADQSGVGAVMFDGSWHHIVLTFSGTGTATFYFDGAYVPPMDSSADDYKLGTRMFIGAQLANNITPENFFAGEMDEVRIYNRALTATDVNELYNYQPPQLTLQSHGGVLQFNGDTSYVSLPTVNGIATNNALTIEAWVNTQLIDGNWHHIFRQDGTNSDLAYGLRFDTYNTSKSINMFINSNGVLGQANFDISGDLNTYTNAWKHISTTYDGSNIKIYVDGVLKNTTPYSETLLEPSGTATIGSFLYDSVSHFNGSVDEIRVWNVAKTENEIKDNMHYQLDGNETGLLAYYNFDERVGDTVYDITSNNYDGTIDGNVTRLNFLGDGLNFSTTSSIINVGNIHNGVTASSKSVWVKLNDTYDNGVNVIMNKIGIDVTKIENSRFAVDTIDMGMPQGCATNEVLEKNKWYHLSSVFDGSTQEVNLYINGELDKTCTVPNTSLDTNSNDRSIGNSIGSTYEFDGVLSQFSLWDKALTQEEIKENMYSIPDISESSLVGYWPLNDGLNAISYISDGATNTNTADLIPGLTSHTSSSEGTAIGDDFSDHYVWEVFDNEIDGTTGEADVWANGSCFGAPCHVGFVFNSAKVINKYTITARAGGIQSPKYITLQGSLDGTTSWTDLETQRYETTWGDSEKRTFSITNSTAYKGYRVAVENDISDYTAIAELEFIEAETFSTIIDKTTNLNNGTIQNPTWIDTAPEIYGNTIYTSQNINTIHQLVVTNNTSVPTYSYNGGVPSEVVDFNGTTGVFSYINTQELNTTLNINANDNNTSLNTLFDVVVYENSIINTVNDFSPLITFENGYRISSDLNYTATSPFSISGASSNSLGEVYITASGNSAKIGADGNIIWHDNTFGGGYDTAVSAFENYGYFIGWATAVKRYDTNETDFIDHSINRAAYYMTSDDNGDLYLLDNYDGVTKQSSDMTNNIWSMSFLSHIADTSSISSDIVYKDGYVYAVGVDWASRQELFVFKLNATDGSIIWQYDVSATANAQDARLAITDEYVYVSYANNTTDQINQHTGLVNLSTTYISPIKSDGKYLYGKSGTVKKYDSNLTVIEDLGFSDTLLEMTQNTMVTASGTTLKYYKNNNIGVDIPYNDGNQSLSFKINDLDNNNLTVSVTNNSPSKVNIIGNFSNPVSSTIYSTGVLDFSLEPLVSSADTGSLDINISDGVNSITKNVTISFHEYMASPYGTEGDDNITGTVNNDMLFGYGGNDYIDGGDGNDTLVLSGNQSQYQVTDNQNGTYTVNGQDGIDTLINIEFLNFDDISNVDISSMVTYTQYYNKYFEIEEPITLTQYDNNASMAINIPFDFYWLDTYHNYDNNNTAHIVVEAGRILFSKDGTLKEVDKRFDNNITYTDEYDDMNYTITNNIVTVQDNNTSEALFEFKLAQTYNNSELTTIYNNYNMDINFSSQAVGYKILGKTLKEEIEVHGIIFDYEMQSSYTSIDTYLNNHTQSHGEYLMSNDINNSKVLFFDQNTTSGNLYEADMDSEGQIINYTAGTWERITGSNIVYEYDNNGTIISGTTNDMILIKPTELGYNYDDAIILGSDGYLHHGNYRDVNSTESFIQLNSFAVNDVAKAIVNHPDINVTFKGQDNSEVFQNTHLAYDELFYIRTDDTIYQDNNITFDSINEIFTLTANQKAGEDSRANIRVYFSDKNATTGISADVNLTDANTSDNKGHMWAVLQNVTVANSNDLNITNNIANIYAGITVKGNGLFSFVTVYDENWTERWSVDNLSEYNTTMLYDPDSSFMINKKVNLNINIDDNNTLIFEAFDENNIQLGNTHYFTNQYLTFDAIDRSELRARVDDRSMSSSPTSTMKVYNFTSLQSFPNSTPTFDQNITAIAITEGNSIVTTFSASDIENDNLTYFIDGLDSSLFNINSTTGELSFNSIPDYLNPMDSNNDNMYEINVNVTDSYSTSTQSITITVVEDASTTYNDVTLIDQELWKETITSGTHQFTNNTTHASVSLNKITNDLSTVAFYQDNLGSRKEAIAEVDLTNLDEYSMVQLLVSDGTSFAIISVSSQQANASIILNGELAFTQSIYDQDTSNPFLNKRLKLNIWITNNEINFNITDQNNNQIGRHVQSYDGYMTNFSQHTIIGNIDGINSTNSSLNFNFYGITSNSVLTNSYYKRLPFIEFKIDSNTYTNATALNINNTKMFEIQTDIDWQDTEYLNLKFGQINPYTDEVLESSVTINHKGVVTEDKKEILPITNIGNVITLENEEIKYVGTQTTAQMNTALADANIPYTIQNGGGYKMYSKQLLTQCRIHNADSYGNYNSIDDFIYDNTQYNGYSYLTRNNYDNFNVLQFSTTSGTTSGDLVQYNVQDDNPNYSIVGTWDIKNNITCTNEDDGSSIILDIIDINTTEAGYEYTDFGYKDGVKYHIEYAQKDETFEMYFFDETSAKELAEDYGLTTTPVKQKVLTDTYNYLSLPSTMTLCNSSFQSALPTICNQDYDIETVFLEADTVFKYTGYWSYWSPNTSIASNQYALNILSSLNNKEGFIVKISGDPKTLNLPYNLYGSIEKDIIDLYKTGWFLTGGQIGYNTSSIETIVQEQGKTLKYMLQLNDNIWNIHAPLNDVEIDSTIPRMNNIIEEESFWIYVE